ncbi:hypothetical protein OHB26_00325 [Nocardia sp. NBC_01503]|uniref:hypothetical protein n=1 Tax=Nocardia sp. NBC_01503 TaxID=2975997 RepID=UPI002E7AB6CB|nr:hypothetical protein [Nocardia sp. NBC_01503]WTL32761.1 hypothetical protein OHB26_00325 [Nocardia sp. NBC_01503]
MTRIGVTGHVNVTEDLIPLVYADIALILADAGDPTDLVGISCIARGADSVFAQAVLDAGGHLEVVLPSRNYRERKVKLDHVEKFDELVARATTVRVMDYDEVGRDAYEAANEAVVGTADRLIAVWDSKPSEKGGTGTVVELARAKGVPVEIIWPDGAARR